MVRLPCRAWNCKEPRHVPVYRIGSKRVRCRFVYCESHVRDLLTGDWIYCPVCSSCGVGGCCKHWCPVCEDRHDKEIDP